MATAKKTSSSDTKKGRKRFVDQPGQWINTTPESVKKKQGKAWSDLAASLTPAQKRAMGIKQKKK